MESPSTIHLSVAHYNLCRVHSTLHTSPGVALGITGRIWTLEELIHAAVAPDSVPARLDCCALRSDDTDARREPRRCFGRSHRSVRGIQGVAYGLTTMVRWQRWNSDESIHVSGVEVSIMGHDRPRWRSRFSTPMSLASSLPAL